MGLGVRFFSGLISKHPSASKSAVFVGFGSECKLRKDFEIAYGLEVSELLFLRAPRKPSWQLMIMILYSVCLGLCD